MQTSIKQTVCVALSVGVLLAVSVAPVFADDASPMPSPSLRPGQIIRQTLRKEIQTEQGDIRSDHSKMHAARISAHFAFYSLRLTNIDNRIQSLIDKKHIAGKNTDAAQTQLNTAKATLLQAVADGNKAVDMFNNIAVGAWSLQKPEVQAAIAQAQLARKEFAQARAQSMQVVRLLQNL